MNGGQRFMERTGNRPGELPIPSFIRFVLEKLDQKGYEAFVVGGAVRDACMGREIRDWDVATDAEAEAICSVFSDVRSFRLKHDTVSLVHKGVTYEITPFRGVKDASGSLSGDLAHRDFTINAMAYDAKRGNIVDPWEGRRDLKDRRIRAVGRPEDRFQEDPLRLLRTVRFAAVLDFHVEEATLRGVQALADRVVCASPERIRDELLSLLLASRPSRGLRLLRQTGLMAAILPELEEGHRMHQNEHHKYTILRHVLETVDRVEATPLLRWTALLHDVAKPRVRRKVDGRWRFSGHAEASADLAHRILTRLRIQKALISKVTHLIRHHMIGYDPEWSERAVRRWIRRVGPDHVFSLLAFRKADILAHGNPHLRGHLLEELETRVRGVLAAPVATRRGQLAVDGRKIMEVTGLGPGPEVGRILGELLERVVDDPGLNTEEALLKLAGKIRESLP
jgi:tRNA nucleotidyltransferase/poly(A) polymerase